MRPDHATSGESRRQRRLDQRPDPHTGSQQATGDQHRHHDDADIRRHFGVARNAVWPTDDAEEMTQKNLRDVAPDDLTPEKTAAPNVRDHARDYNDPDALARSTDFLCVGPPGSGNSSVTLKTAVRCLEGTDEQAVWQVSTARSEWVLSTGWTQGCPPAGVDRVVRSAGGQTETRQATKPQSARPPS